MTTRDLGLDSQILRRDHLYGSLLSEGTVASVESPAALLRRSSTGPISQYVVAQGSTKEPSIVMFDTRSPATAGPNGEVFDIVVVGAGVSGLAAAYYVQQETGGRARVLILENHEMFGGNSRRDEFQVNGQTLYAPQASTVIQDLPPALAPSERASNLFRELGIDLTRIRVPEDQYFFGIFRDDNRAAGPTWYPNIFAAPLSDIAKKDLGAFFETVMHFYDDGDWRAKLAGLDKVTFRDFLRQQNWTDELFRMMQPELGAFFGFPEAVSAACVYSHYGSLGPRYIHGFPGGNSGLARHLVNALIPAAFRPDPAGDAVMHGRPDASALDRPSNATRLRLASSVVRVEHEGDADSASHVAVTIASRGKHYGVRARGVIMACGGFASRHIVADMPASQREAYEQFIYAPVLWANVALNNSRALENAKLNFLSTYLDGFGGLLLRYEKIASTSADPERPNVIGVGCPLSYPGVSARAQEHRAQQELLETPFREYEIRIREDLVRTLGPWGFDPKRDIAAIAIHRWAQHGYIFGYPGFFTSGVVERARQPFGRITFAHTDLHKFSLVMGAVEQGHRAAREISARLKDRHAGAAD
jgi:spermidine dehydrogenase